MVGDWQAHGAQMEAVRSEFDTDAQSIRDILRLWQVCSPAPCARDCATVEEQGGGSTIMEGCEIHGTVIQMA